MAAPATTDKRVRVMHVASGIGLGGTARALLHLVEALDRSLFDVSAAGLLAVGELGERLPAQGIVALGFDNDPRRLEEHLRRERPAIVHVHVPGRADALSIAVLGAIERAAPPVVVETNVFGSYDERTSPACLSLRLFVSKTALLRFCTRVPRIGADFLERHQVLYNPVDVARLEALRAELQPRRESIRARLGIAPGEFVVGRIGRPDDVKWSSLLVPAFAQLLASRPEARLLLQAAAPQARREIQAAGLEGRCILLEMTADERALAETYVALDVVAATSRIGESFGYTIAEGMRFRLPVVANQTPRRDNAQVELIESGRTGYVAFTAPGLGQAFELLAADPARRKAFGEAGALATRRFDARTIARDLEVRYARLLARRGLALPAALGARLSDPASPSPTLDELRAYPAEYRRRMRAVVGGLDLRSRYRVTAVSLRSRSTERRLRACESAYS
jgi:glycosyltransferase involved in cell wall biosynthesis